MSPNFANKYINIFIEYLLVRPKIWKTKFELNKFNVFDIYKSSLSLYKAAALDSNPIVYAMCKGIDIVYIDK